MEKIDQDQYNEILERYHDEKYENMSDEEKMKYDEMVDKAIRSECEVVDNDGEEGEDGEDSNEGKEGEGTKDISARQKSREDYKGEYNYEDMTPEQKRDFDQALDEYYGSNENVEREDTGEKENTGEKGDAAEPSEEPEKVRKLR